MQNSKAELEASGVQVLAISTDSLEGPVAFAAREGIEFPILYTTRDPSVPEAYGVFNLFGDGLASASVFLIDKQGEVAWKSIGTDYTHQVFPEEILEQVEKLG